MLGFPISLVQLLGTGRGVFTSDDIANGTLVLNFVDRPLTSLSMDFTNATYSQWAADSTSSLSGLVGYYQVKG